MKRILFLLLLLAASTFGPWLKCGWALCTAGAPCVAQRVWAMPV